MKKIEEVFTQITEEEHMRTRNVIVGFSCLSIN
jgi:hypothetical protein